MRISKIAVITSCSFFVAVLLMVAGMASCSNPNQRPSDTFFPMFPDPLPKSPVGLIISDPVFRQNQPDPLIEDAYYAAALTPMTTSDLWNYFTSATTRIDLVGTHVTNSDMVARLVAIAGRGVELNIVCEKGFFNSSESAPLISQLYQAGNVTLKTDNDDIARQVHSRYAIIDDHIVLSSSGDFLHQSFNQSVNNVLVIDTPRTYVNGSGAAGVKTVTDAFLFDFDQMFNQGKFGGDKEILINRSFNIGCQVEVYFGPNDDLLEVYIEQINNMQASVTYMINQVTDTTMLMILRDLAMAGLYDGPSNPDYKDPDYMDGMFLLETATVFNWAGYNSLNHKIMIVDLPIDFSNRINPILLDFFDPVIIAGSNNWTNIGLNLNDEQLLVIHDLTLGYELGAVEFGVLSREALDLGVMFGKVRTYKNQPVFQARVQCDSEEIPGTPFMGSIAPLSGQSDMEGFYSILVPSGFLRNIQVIGLGDAGGGYLFPIPIWGEDLPNDGWNLLPGASYEMDFYLQPRPTATGTGGGGGGGGGGG